MELLSKEEDKNARLPERLILTKNVRVFEHGADGAKGYQVNDEVLVSGDDKLTLLQSGQAVRKPGAKESNEAETNSVNAESIQPETQKKKFFGLGKAIK